MIQAEGKNGSITFDGTMIFIKKIGGLGSFFNQGVQGDRWIVARTVTAVEFRENGKGGGGFIAFDFPGKNPPRGGVYDALADENAVVFNPDQAADFKALRDAIVAYITAVNRALDATFGTANETTTE